MTDAIGAGPMRADYSTLSEFVLHLPGSRIVQLRKWLWITDPQGGSCVVGGCLKHLEQQESFTSVFYAVACRPQSASPWVEVSDIHCEVL